MAKDVTNIDRIIAKIDNDFNPDNSDWIPRVGAWVHDALGILQISTTERVKEKFKVIDKIAYNKCPFVGDIKVYDKNGCEIKELDEIKYNCGCGTSIPFTGEQNKSNPSNGANTVGIVTNDNPADVPDKVIDYPGKGKDYTSRTVVEVWDGSHKQIACGRNYVLIDCKNIELNFDTDYIIVEYNKIKQCHSNIYNCDFPEIPNNAKVIEYLAYYCIYKMLLRGYKHPVLNLHASQYGTNPYYIAKSMEEEAKRSYINQGINEDLTDLWRSAFFIGTFNPRG